MAKPCRCFWADEDGTCAREMIPVKQEGCPLHAYRINPMTGEKWGPLEGPPERKED
jgi:hypothetical protein